MLTAISFPSFGISMDPSPVAFTILGKDIYWYGLIIAVGFLMAYFYMSARAKTFGLTKDHVLDILLWAVPIGIVGARAYYCIFNWELYRENPISCLYIWEGGLAIYGGVIGGVLGLTIYSKLSKLPIWTILDLASFGVLIGQIFGRWGNFFNREAHGGETEIFLRMGLTEADGVTRYYHPTFLYESCWNLLGLILLHVIAKKRKFDGQMFLMYLFWYGLGRAMIEGLRTDSLYLFGTGIRVSQLLAVCCVAVSGAILFYRLVIRKSDHAKLYMQRSGSTTEEGLENS